MNLLAILLAQGFAAGFLYSFVAVAGLVLAMRYIIQSGWLVGFSFGLGVSTVQIIWAAIAALGIAAPSLMSGFDNQYMGLIGGAVLFVFAFKLTSVRYN